MSKILRKIISIKLLFQAHENSAVVGHIHLHADPVDNGDDENEDNTELDSEGSSVSLSLELEVMTSST